MGLFWRRCQSSSPSEAKGDWGCCVIEDCTLKPLGKNALGREPEYVSEGADWLSIQCRMHPSLQTRSFLPRMRLVSKSDAGLCVPHLKQDMVVPIPVRLAGNGDPGFFSVYRSPSSAIAEAGWGGLGLSGFVMAGPLLDLGSVHGA